MTESNKNSVEPIHDPVLVEAFRQLCLENTIIPEEIIRGVYQAVLTRGDTVIDCGAHKGYHTKPMLEVCRDGHTLAYEAIPHLAKKLSKQLSHFQGLIVRSCAVQGDPDLKKVSFQYVPDRPGRSGIISATINRVADHYYDFEEIEVEASTIDHDLMTLGLDPGSVAFVKLDLEGGEFGALQGAKNPLQSGRPVIAFENGRYSAETMGYTNQEFDEFLDSVGYVRISVFGSFLYKENFDFYYLFAAPKEKSEMVRKLVLGLTAASFIRNGKAMP